MTVTQFLPLISFLGIATGIGALLLGMKDVFSRVKREDAVKRELSLLPRFADTTGDLGAMGRFDDWFDRTLYMSGLKMTSHQGVLLLLLVCLAAGGGVFVLMENEILTVIAGTAAIACTMIAILVAKHRRMRRFEQQFPHSLDLLARAVRAGESLDQSLLLVGESTSDPVGPEFLRCAKQLDMGLSLAACMKAFSHRLNVMDVRIFCTTLSVHREAGGNLPLTLERLAAVIRDRMDYHRHLKSVTAAGRFSALLISILGPVLFVYLFAFQPQYGGSLVSDPLGRTLLVVAVVSQLIGTAWVLRMLKTDY